MFPVIEMRQDLGKLKRVLAAVVEAMGYELVGVEFHARSNGALLRVYIDGETVSLWTTANGSVISSEACWMSRI